MTVQLNQRQMSVARQLMGNATYPNLGALGSIYGYDARSVNYKHNLNYDFGYPETEELTFDLFYDLWKRNGIAKGLVTKTVGKTWQENPVLREEEDDEGEETAVEKDIRQHFQRIRFWQHVQECDMRSMVGKYAGLIFQLGDGKPYHEPVDGRVPGGIEGLISVLPAWEGQLEPSSWNTDNMSPGYGKPSMFRFNESQVDPENGKVRSFMVHPDRCLIWSRDGTTFGDSKFESCYNALSDVSKIRGAGGEGFWKNAKSQPVLEADKDVDFNQLATMLGVELDGIADALDEVVGKWSKGFDDSLVVQGMKVTNLPVTLPLPQEFFNIAVQEISASWPIPQKVLLGMQTGERASTEDAKEWSQICMSRRENLVIPNMMELIDRLEAWQILPERDWFIDWADLTAPSLEEKVKIADSMASVNQRMFAMGEPVYTPDELRAVTGYEALGDVEFAEPMDEEEDIEEDDV